MESAVFIDLDKTIISVSTEKSFILYLFKIKKIKLTALLHVYWAFIRYRLGLMKNPNSAKKKYLK